ncbi:hypothetical protein ACFL27_06870 [candidate division CSSED10-310 bacterium]|uniref:Uncharacterized protein n=1 Tax=candidate division CSSED10-310 bacterium TaxID=2855610 RepID=A0ABV6YUS4_UNCC1
MTKQVAIFIAFVAGLLPIIGFFVPLRFVREKLVATLDEWLIIVAAFALVLGVNSVIKVNILKISRRQKGWINSIIYLLALFSMAILGITMGIGERPDGSVTPFSWMFRAMVDPMTSTMFSLLAFFIASAAFRAFRARTIEASLLLVAAIIVMLGRIDLGVSLKIPEITEWIMNTPNMAAQRGIIIGAALGGASMALRVILGIERPYIGQGE